MDLVFFQAHAFVQIGKPNGNRIQTYLYDVVDGEESLADACRDLSHGLADAARGSEPLFPPLISYV